jgi:hypothetical protein
MEVIEQEERYIDWLDDFRPVVLIRIDDIFCKHESDYSLYRNNYRGQFIDLFTNPHERFTIERERNRRLVAKLKEKGDLYPIALHEFKWSRQHGHMCIDGHHRIMAYLASRRDFIPGFVYNDCDEAGRAKANAPLTDYYKDLMEIDKEIGA